MLYFFEKFHDSVKAVWSKSYSGSFMVKRDWRMFLVSISVIIFFALERLHFIACSLSHPSQSAFLTSCLHSPPP